MNDRRRLPHWDYAGDINRLQAASRALREFPTKAFTLNLGHDLEASLLADRKQVINRIHKRIKNAPLRHLPNVPDFAFIPEFTRSGRLHLHGIIVVTPGYEEQTARALREAGGTWEASHPEFQLDLRAIWNGDGWATYCEKTASRTRKFLGVRASILSMTQGLRRQAKSVWQSLREEELKERARHKRARWPTSSIVASLMTHGTRVRPDWPRLGHSALAAFARSGACRSAQRLI